MGKLILMNRLGNATEVQHSVIGSNFAIGGAPDYAAAKFGNGIRINANTEIVSIANTPAQYDLAKGCIEMWIKLPYNIVDSKGSNGMFFSWWNGDVIEMYSYCKADTGFIWDMKSGTIWNQILTDFDVSANTLAHLAWTWDRTLGTEKRKLYLNGVKIGSNNLAWTDVNTSAWTFYIGLYRGYILKLNGIIDNIKWWNYAKTDFSDRHHERAGLRDQVLI